MCATGFKELDFKFASVLARWAPMAIGDSCVFIQGSTSTNGSQTGGITIGNILFFQVRGKVRKRLPG